MRVYLIGAIGGILVLCLAWLVHWLPFVVPGSLIGGASGVAVALLMVALVQMAMKRKGA